MSDLVEMIEALRQQATVTFQFLSSAAQAQAIVEYIP
jgi:hypothetical protein